MKKFFLSICATALISMQSVSAQTDKTWNFSEGSWTSFAGVLETTVVDQLGFVFNVSSSNPMGNVESSGSGTYPDGSTYTHRLKYNGGSYISGTTDFAMPTQRYMYIKVAGPSTISVWYRNGGGGERKFYITDGTQVLFENAHTGSSAPDNQLITYNYTGGEGYIYFAANQAINVNKITATNVIDPEVLSVNSVSDAKVSAIAVAQNGKVHLKGINTVTQVSVYNMYGGLVKSLNTKSDIDFELGKGVYIVNMQTEKGVKSQKVLVR